MPTAPRVVFFTGAGMSAESGIPTFRDALTGLWSRFDPAELACEAGFRRDPALVWGWYRWRAARASTAMPHAGHAAITALQDVGHTVTVVTQNVDDLHERAGHARVLHLHGSLFASRCIDCGRPADPEPMREPLPEGADAGVRLEPPPCPDCRGLLRPGVVWFGETLPDAAWQAALQAIDACDLLLVVGTSGLVHPAALLPERAARLGRRVIVIDPDPTGIDAIATQVLRLPASAGLQQLQRLL